MLRKKRTFQMYQKANVTRNTDTTSHSKRAEGAAKTKPPQGLSRRPRPATAESRGRCVDQEWRRRERDLSALPVFVSITKARWHRLLHRASQTRKDKNDGWNNEALSHKASEMCCVTAQFYNRSATRVESALAVLQNCVEQTEAKHEGRLREDLTRR